MGNNTGTYGAATISGAFLAERVSNGSCQQAGSFGILFAATALAVSFVAVSLGIVVHIPGG